MNTSRTTPISITSEVARLRALARGPTRAAAESAHRYAELATFRSDRDEERRALATTRLNAIVSMCAELSRQITTLERELLTIADILE